MVINDVGFHLILKVVVYLVHRDLVDGMRVEASSEFSLIEGIEARPEIESCGGGIMWFTWTCSRFPESERFRRRSLSIYLSRPHPRRLSLPSLPRKTTWRSRKSSITWNSPDLGLPRKGKESFLRVTSWLQNITHEATNKALNGIAMEQMEKFDTIGEDIYKSFQAARLSSTFNFSRSLHYAALRLSWNLSCYLWLLCFSYAQSLRIRRSAVMLCIVFSEIFLVLGILLVMFFFALFWMFSF